MDTKTDGRITVMVVEDSRTVRFKLAGMIEKMGHRCVLAENGDEALSLYAIERPTLILMDAIMPVLDGYECARRIRTAQGDTWTPIIFLSAAEGDSDIERGIDAGGDDYLVKPVSYVVLQAKIRAQQRIDDMRRRLQDLSAALAEANQRLELLSRQDGLTGLSNRRFFDESLARAVRTASEKGTTLSLLMLDVDCFKSFNDRYGHLPGDECLRHIARAMRRVCDKPHDVVARYGGEEFAVLLADHDIATARTMGEAIRSEVESLALPHSDSLATDHVTVSIGVAGYDPNTDPDGEKLVLGADEALYVAKREGRNRVSLKI